MAKQWTLTIRDGPRVEHAHFHSLEASIEAMQLRLSELEPHVRRKTIDVFNRKFDPVRQVVVRAELSGPGGLWSSIYGGVDLRGDGSAEAYIGRLRRSLVELGPEESPCEGLLRLLSARATR